MNHEPFFLKMPIVLLPPKTGRTDREFLWLNLGLLDDCVEVPNIEAHRPPDLDEHDLLSPNHRVQRFRCRSEVGRSFLYFQETPLTSLSAFGPSGHGGCLRVCCNLLARYPARPNRQPTPAANSHTYPVEARGAETGIDGARSRDSAQPLV